ncbi:tim barrel metal-dependent [Diplodia corticola]|uniref:Tim barrel metal-dependent n=1 Tax=Diplodia corticola TaxID=236234 RepID=A0A1J9S3R4_9PEZI|nr:tim barrel metal-dependent [Diplodia corticola]OJD35191.1 tim barrel metal-dependent [Diplodia corticola]
MSRLLLQPRRALTTIKLHPRPSLPARRHHGTVSTTTPRKVAARIPPDSWDSHMHVTDPAYPLAPTAAYTPPLHTLSSALALTSGAYTIRNLVLVQPSIYGADNSCLLSALSQLGPSHGRAVVGIDPAGAAPSQQQQQEQEEKMLAWHALGVRGVRLNLKSVGRAPSLAQLRADVAAHAAAIPPPLRAAWVLQVYCALDAVPLLERVVAGGDEAAGAALPPGVKLCIDHFGHPALPSSSTDSDPDPYDLPGFDALMRLLRAGRTWVKLSAAYRIERGEGLPWLGAMARELLSVREGGRCVFATDWPHTRFDGVDVEPFVEKCLEWCGGDEKKVERLFRGNAEELWDVKR